MKQQEWQSCLHKWSARMLGSEAPAAKPAEVAKTSVQKAGGRGNKSELERVKQ